MIRLFQPIKLIITKVEECLDKDGYKFLKCKGFARTKVYNPNTQKDVSSKDFFTNIKLYGDENLLEETKQRLWTDEKEKPSINIVSYDAHITNFLYENKLFSCLLVYWYDFQKNKLGYKEKMLKSYGLNKSDYS